MLRRLPALRPAAALLARALLAAPVLLAATLAVGTAGCVGARSSDPTADAAALADALEAEGADLEEVSVGLSPLMAGRGTTFREHLSGDLLRVFVYDRADGPAQHADALALSTDGERPRVYQRNRVVVAHYGGGALLATALRKVLGRPRF